MRHLATRTLFFACVAAGCALVGCTTARAPRYYVLTAPPAAPNAGVSPFPVTILVGRLSAPRVLRDDRVVYGMTDVEIRKSGRCTRCETPDSRVGGAIKKGETQGFIKISVDTETKQYRSLAGGGLLWYSCNRLWKLG